jgi:UTP:GlnB (protein PII) uridylyltransferase
MRVWLADRPGALAQVAGRIGAVGGDVVNIDILERDNGRAIDELTITLPDGQLIPLMLTKIAELDAVEVEDIRALKSDLTDPLQDPLQIAYELLCCDNKTTLSKTLL